MKVPRFVLILPLEGTEWMVPLDDAQSARVFIKAAIDAGYAQSEFVDLKNDQFTDLLDFEETTFSQICHWIDTLEPHFSMIYCSRERYDALAKGLASA